MGKEILVGVIGAVFGAILLYFVLGIPSDVRDIDRRLAKLEGQFDTFTALRDDFAKLKTRVDKVQVTLTTVSTATAEDRAGFEFVDPDAGAVVSRYFRVQGTVRNPPRSGHLWLAVEIGQLAWPKEPEIQVSGTTWSGEVNEGGTPPNGRFRLSLWLVDDAGDARIREWLQQGHTTGHYPGLPGLPGGQRLKSIDLSLK